MAPKSKKEDIIKEDPSESESTSSAELSHESESDAQHSDSQGESESDNSSATSSDEDEKNALNEPVGQKSSFRAAGPYKPPLGFKSAKNFSPPSSSTSSLLSDLRGKQVFHITAPAFLPLSKVKEVSLSRVLQGEPVLTHEGVKYGIPAESMKESDIGQSLFTYNSKSETYHSTVTNVPSYHIQELVDLPDSSEQDLLIAEAAKRLEKPPRKQPKHLKMRFRPVGSGDVPPETLGSSSESEEEEITTFKVPKGHGKEKERKRKLQQAEGDGNQPAGLPRKKSKKHSLSGVSESTQTGTEQERSKKSSKDRDGKKRKKTTKAA